MTEHIQITDMYIEYLESELGTIEISATGNGIASVYFIDQKQLNTTSNQYTNQCKQQLQEYLNGERQQFDICLDQQTGTDFQRQVWQALLTIPFGQIASYTDIAKQINRPKAVRAVGAANGKNPTSIIVPCHRIIGSNGTLTGYAGGIARKQWLLQHESNVMFKV